MSSVKIIDTSIPIGSPKKVKLEALFAPWVLPASILVDVRVDEVTKAFSIWSAKLTPIRPVESQKTVCASGCKLLTNYGDVKKPSMPRSPARLVIVPMVFG